MKLEDGWCGMSEEAVRSMSHEQLIQSVLRLIKVPIRNAEDYYGSVLLPDEIADAFRGRS